MNHFNLRQTAGLFVRPNLTDFQREALELLRLKAQEGTPLKEIIKELIYLRKPYLRGDVRSQPQQVHEFKGTQHVNCLQMRRIEDVLNMQSIAHKNEKIVLMRIPTLSIALSQIIYDETSSFAETPLIGLGIAALFETVYENYQLTEEEKLILTTAISELLTNAQKAEGKKYDGPAHRAHRILQNGISFKNTRPYELGTKVALAKIGGRIMIEQNETYLKISVLSRRATRHEKEKIKNLVKIFEHSKNLSEAEKFNYIRNMMNDSEGEGLGFLLMLTALSNQFPGKFQFKIHFKKEEVHISIQINRPYRPN